MDRRLFLKGALATGVLAANSSRLFASPTSPSGLILPGPKAGKSEQDLCDAIIAHAKSLGASYCDVRLVRMLSQSINARENMVQGISDNESYGMGIRVIKNGTWGFAATRNV